MSKPFYVRFNVTEELADDAYNILDIARDTGKIEKGTNAVSKAVERKKAKLVIIPEDVEPPEIVAHLPLLCDEKNIPYTYVPSKRRLGEKCGLQTSAASASITRLGRASDLYKSFMTKLEELKEEQGVRPRRLSY